MCGSSTRSTSMTAPSRITAPPSVTTSPGSSRMSARIPINGTDGSAWVASPRVAELFAQDIAALAGDGAGLALQPGEGQRRFVEFREVLRHDAQEAAAHGVELAARLGAHRDVDRLALLMDEIRAHLGNEVEA